MTGRYGLLLAFLLTLTAAASAQDDPSPESAAKPGFGSFRQLLSTKGIVTAKGEGSLAISEGGGGVLHVLVTQETRVTGLRTLFAKVAVSDIVRVEGTPPSSTRTMTAHQIEVLFAAETTERSQPRSNFFWDWIKTRGLTLDLP